MTLSNGTRLSHYEITSQIGKGGMGEVYQAKDTKLGRNVAIKVLPQEFAQDADRVARFQREAKLLASLNHPNIAAIYGLEESDGTNFLVMELVEGNNLDDRINSGPIPVEEALKLALQIAEALEAAHEKGVIHRDLKPANIKVTPDGKVKVLDFGLAKAFAGEQADLNLSNSPTLSHAATMQGVILGTAAYMSPEQAKGKTVDKRTDIWAFGAVLFEMLTGKAAFQGDEVSEILASVIKGDTNLDLLPSNIHQRINEGISRCLQKDIRRRYADIADALYEIEQALSDPSGVFAQPIRAESPQKPLRTILPWVAAAIIVAGATVWYFKPITPPEPRPVMRFYHELSEDQEFTDTAGSLIDLSADGTKIVYVANEKLYLRNLNDLTARPIQGSAENPITPIFSPDGLYVAYYAMGDDQWRKIRVSGGAPVTLCAANPPAGATWGSDNTILFEEYAVGIKRVSGESGTAQLLIEEKEGERFHRPQALPGGEWVLFSISGKNVDSWDDAQIVAESLKTKERRMIVSGGSDARYIPTGHLVYARGDALYAQAFDVDGMKPMGEETAIVAGVRRAAITASANYDVSDTGMLAYVVGNAEANIRTNLVWVDRNGNGKPLGAESRAYGEPRISPDGSRVALTITVDGNEDIYVFDLDRGGNPSRLTLDENDDNRPVWTPNSQRIIFSSGRVVIGSIYWKSADGTGKAEQVGPMSGIAVSPNSILDDGNTLFFEHYAGPAQEMNISLLSMEGDSTPKLLLQGEYEEIRPQISPDGRWLAYMSDETGQFEVYIRPFPDIDSGLKRQISTDGGTDPLWSPNSKELFYVSPDDEAMVVTIEAEPILRPGKPQKLFSVEQYRGWDIDPDGKRFLILKEFTNDMATEEELQPRINMIANWFEELKEKVPMD
ncbi:MAG: protein kinase [Acidobacteria bacterium]|nr:protein kinase [Acidobacteriota bacterium]